MARVNKRDVIAVLCEVTFSDTSRTVSEAGGQKKQKCAYPDHQPSLPVVIETLTTCDFLRDSDRTFEPSLEKLTPLSHPKGWHWPHLQRGNAASVQGSIPGRQQAYVSCGSPCIAIL